MALVHRGAGAAREAAVVNGIANTRKSMSLPQSRHNVGTCSETSSHAPCKGTFGHSRLSSLGHCGLVLG